MARLVVIIIGVLIAFNVVCGAWWALHGNIYFHTDIARDFLLIEDIVDHKNISLIGPRSGAIPGVFHGPLWLYLNVPAFILGNGNPAVVGWFWVVLGLSNILIIYFIGKKMFDHNVGLLSALLLSVLLVPALKNLFNPFGALLLVLPFFYLFWLYLQIKDIRFLALSLFVLGLIIQFQMAFGLPILILTISYLSVFLMKNKQVMHLFALLALLPPLSTYLLFDIRHNFLQFKSVVNYLTGSENHGKVDLSLVELLGIRANEAIREGIGMVTNWHLLLSAILIIIVTILLFRTFQKREWHTSPYFLFAYFYCGFWIISLLFKGPIWSYYFWPFMPILVLIFTSSFQMINKKVFLVIFFAIYIVNAAYGLKNITEYENITANQDQAMWAFNYQIAKTVFEDASGEFGYYIFTPDLYGYYPRYAMNYTQKEFLKKPATPFQKKQETYLLIAPPPEYGKDPSSQWYQKNTNSNQWKIDDVRINRQPDQVWNYANGFKVEKYQLTNEEMAATSNPYLIQDLTFR